MKGMVKLTEMRIFKIVVDREGLDKFVILTLKSLEHDSYKKNRLFFFAFVMVYKCNNLSIFHMI